MSSLHENQSNCNFQSLNHTNELIRHRRTQVVSSSSSLDSFLMEFPDDSYFLGPFRDVLMNDDTIDGVHLDENTTVDNSIESTRVSTTSLDNQLQKTCFEFQTDATSTTTTRLIPNVESGDPSDHVVGARAANTVPEFLYQLTKMLTHDNKDIIEWSDGRIEVHSPQKLESQVLNKYFRHSKFASFQRQLNYFGFRKLAGKGKMSPCSYVNEAAGKEISSLLYIKRKGTVINPRETTVGKNKKKDSTNKRSTGGPNSRSSRRPAGESTNNASDGLSEENQPVKATEIIIPVMTVRNPASGSEHQALARKAVGRGVRHAFTAPGSQSGNNSMKSKPSSSTYEESSTNNLSQLATNYNNVLSQNEEVLNNKRYDEQCESDDPTPLSQMQQQDTVDSFNAFLSRNSSLVDLAMIARVDDLLPESSTCNTVDDSFMFVDFPNLEYPPI